MVKVDLKDAYFTIPIHQDHQKYLRFMVDRTCYQFTCLPFGLSCAPWTFTKVMKPLMTLLRSWGIRIIIYIDDMLTLANSREEATQHLEVLVLLESLGFIINQEKSLLSPVQEIEFLGLIVDSLGTQLQLPGEKLRQIRKEATHLLTCQVVSAHQLSQFIGKLNATAQAIQVAHLFYRALQANLQEALAVGNQNYNQILPGEGQIRLDVGSSSVPQDQRSPGTSRDQLIRFTDDLPAATVFQLEARPPSSSSGCLSTGLESVERVCQPPHGA